MVSREAEGCFEVTVQARQRLSSLGEAMSGQGAHRRAMVTRPAKRYVICQIKSIFHTFGESNVSELRRHFQKSLLERIDVFNTPCQWVLR